MPHFVYEIPRGVAPTRQIGAYADYVEASAFARAERQRREFADEAMILVIHAADTAQGDASARVMRERFDEVRKSRPAPVARVSHFIREYGEEKPDAEAPGRSVTAVVPWLALDAGRQHDGLRHPPLEDEIDQRDGQAGEDR